MTDQREPIAFRVNGESVEVRLPHGEILATVLRDHLGLKGTNVSCGVEVCGACTVLVDGEPASSCVTMLADVRDRDVVTIEGLRGDPLFQEIEDALVAHRAVQCGFCTPGLVVTLAYLTTKQPPSKDLAADLAGNLCRCTGYKSILAAAAEVVPVERAAR